MPPRTGPLDRAELDRVLGDVRRLADRVDVVTVLPHWGTQYTERPEPIQEYVARQLVRAGADLVVGGHPHWVQGASLVGDGLVVHSLGNFTFDMTTPETNEGLVLEATFWDDELKAVDFVPYRIGADHAPRVVPYAEAERMFANFWRFSGLGEEVPDDPADPAQLLGVDDGGDVGGRVVAGVRRAAEPRGRQPGVGERLVVAGGVQLDGGADAEPLGRPHQRGPDRDRGAAAPTRSAPPCRRRPGPSTPWRAGCGARRATSARRSGASRSGAQVAGAARLLAAERDEDDGQRRPAGPTAARGLEQHGDAGGVVLGARRDGDGVEVGADEQVRRSGSKPFGRATTLADVPASTGTPHESPAGTGKGCRVTS